MENHSKNVQSIEVVVLLLFLNDGLVYSYDEFKIEGQNYESGDLIHFDRGAILDESESKMEPAVILGHGETRKKARRISLDYLAQVAKLHGQEGLANKLTYGGYDLSQSQELQDSESDSDTDFGEDVPDKSEGEEEEFSQRI